MPSVEEYRAAIRAFAGDSSQFCNILGAAENSNDLLVRARAALADVNAQGEGIAALAIGSIGRLEALEASDMDFSVLYNAERATADTANDAMKEMRERLIAAGFEDISAKTFKDPMKVGELLKNVGGNDDSNLSLTYRALIPTEAAWLFNKAEVTDLVEKIVKVYQSGLATRGRFLTSLSNDLHRYYRTLCVDYRYKIEEDNKGWAIRNMKLRHSRKLWHLSNLCLQCAAADITDIDEHDGFLSAHLGEPPLLKLITSLSATKGLDSCRTVWTLYDTFLGLIRQDSFRRALDELCYEDREESPEFNEIQSNAKEFDMATRRVVEHLLARHSDYLIRYGIL